MSIKPLDMQVLLPKSAEVSKIKQIGNEKFNQEQYNLGLRETEKNQKQQETVIKKEDSQSVKLKEREKGHSGNQSKEKKKKQQVIKQQRRSRVNGYYLGHFDAKI